MSSLDRSEKREALSLDRVERLRCEKAGSREKGRHVESSQSHVNSSLSHSQRLSGVSIDPSLRLTSVSLPSLLPAVSAVSQ